MKTSIKIYYNIDMNEINNSTGYPTLAPLIIKIKELITTGKQKIENEKIITYWHIGKHIKEHLLHYRERAEYGEYVFATLATELSMGKRLLYKTMQFYERYPVIVRPAPQLTWSHYDLLLILKERLS